MLEGVGLLTSLSVYGMAYLGSFLVLLIFAQPKNPPADANQHECEETDGSTRDQASPDSLVLPLRLTSEGLMVDRCEYSHILDAIGSTECPTTVVLYVHGWRHSADERDTDRQRFTSFVERLATEAGAGRQVVGVYVGWPGGARFAFLELLTFWGRKRAADRISQAAVVTKLLGAIDNLTNRADNQDLVVLVGHSFGARILYSATAQLLLHRFQMAHLGREHGSYDRVVGPADMILLLNPAMEASIYSVIDGMRRADDVFDPQQQPLMMSISTDNDFATKWAFPIGQMLALAPRTDTERQTLGNLSRFTTHDLVEPLGQPPSVASRKWWDHYRHAGFSLVRRDTPKARSPFVVARTNKRLLDGHNGVWNDRFTAWLEGFISELATQRPD